MLRVKKRRDRTVNDPRSQNAARKSVDHEHRRDERKSPNCKRAARRLYTCKWYRLGPSDFRYSPELIIVDLKVDYTPNDSSFVAHFKASRRDAFR